MNSKLYIDSRSSLRWLTAHCFWPMLLGFVAVAIAWTFYDYFSLSAYTLLNVGGLLALFGKINGEPKTGRGFRLAALFFSLQYLIFVVTMCWFVYVVFAETTRADRSVAFYGWAIDYLSGIGIAVGTVWLIITYLSVSNLNERRIEPS